MLVNKKECLGCGTCESVCPVNAITVKEGIAVINKDKCVGCGTCKDSCPVGAIVND